MTASVALVALLEVFVNCFTQPGFGLHAHVILVPAPRDALFGGDPFCRGYRDDPETGGWGELKHAPALIRTHLARCRRKTFLSRQGYGKLGRRGVKGRSPGAALVKSLQIKGRAGFRS